MPRTNTRRCWVNSRDSQRRVKKITLVSWTEARIIFYLFCLALMCSVWIYSGPGFSFEGMAMLEAAASMPSAVFSVQADRDKWLLFEAAEGQ